MKMTFFTYTLYVCFLCRIWKDMSLNDSLSELERSKLAVWDYPVSDKYTKVQRVLNDLQRTRLSHPCIIWLLHHPLYPPLPPLTSVSSTGDTKEDWKRDILLLGYEKREWGRSQIIQPQDSLVLYKSFNTLYNGTNQRVCTLFRE